MLDEAEAAGGTVDVAAANVDVVAVVVVVAVGVVVLSQKPAAPDVNAASAQLQTNLVVQEAGSCTAPHARNKHRAYGYALQ